MPTAHEMPFGGLNLQVFLLAAASATPLACLTRPGVLLMRARRVLMCSGKPFMHSLRGAAFKSSAKLTLAAPARKSQLVSTDVVHEVFSN